MGKYFLERKASLERKKGFSLIEVSVAIVVVAGATVGLLSWTQPPASTNALKAIETQAKLQEVQKAIEAFRVKKKRLPCPSDPLMRSDGTRSSVGTNYLTPTGASNDYYINDFGTEDLDTTQTIINGTTTLGIDCAVSVGALPVFSLGLNETYINDAWGRRFTYHVAPSLCGADTGVPGSPNATQIAESESIGCTDKDYKNKTGNITVTTKTPATKLTTVASYVVVSHGSNGKGAFLPSGSKLADAGGSLADTTGNELENSNGDAIYVKTDQRTDPSSTFDDIVVFATKNQVESLTNRKNIKHISVADCEANSQAIKNITLLETGFMDTQLGGYKQITSQATKNTGDQALLGIMKSLQSMCVAYYGAAAATINGQTWSGAQCPGNNNPVGNGSTYNAATDSCSCPSGTWSGNCATLKQYMAVVTANSSPNLTIYDLSDWSLVPGIPAPGGGRNSVAFSPNGQYLAVTGYSSPYLVVYNTSDWSQVSGAPVLSDQSWGVTFSPDNIYMAVSDSAANPYIRVYRTSDWSQVAGIPAASAYSYRLAFSPNGAYLAITTSDASPYVVVYNTSDWSKVAGIPAAANNSFAVVFSKNGTYMAVGSYYSPYLTVYNTSNWSTVAGIPAHSNIVYGIDFSSDNKYMAVSSNNALSDSVKVYDMTSGWSVSSLTNPTQGTDIAFSYTGQYMAVTGGSSPYLVVYKTSDWSQVSVGAVNGIWAYGVAFSPPIVQ